MRPVLMLVLVLLSVSAVRARQYFPVLDDPDQATIVYSAGLSEADEASATLASYLKQATERDFAVTRETASEAQRPRSFPIYVGRCQLTQKLFGDDLAELDQDAFMVIVEPERAFLVGRMDHGTYWAVCDFLER